MAIRGRKSAASLTLASVGTLEHIPKPPETMPEDQRKTWELVVRSPANQMISQESLPILLQYCRQVAAADAIAKQLDEFDLSWLADEDGLKRWDRLMGMQARESAAMANLATKLRLTPQTRTKQEKAGTIARNAVKRKPWEIEQEPEETEILTGFSNIA